VIIHQRRIASTAKLAVSRSMHAPRCPAQRRVGIAQSAARCDEDQSRVQIRSRRPLPPLSGWPQPTACLPFPGSNPLAVSQFTDFPFLFASDADNDGATYTVFGGGLRSNNLTESSAVIVIGPDGRVAATIEIFNQNDPMAYEALGEASATAPGPTVPYASATKGRCESAAVRPPEGSI